MYDILVYIFGDVSSQSRHFVTGVVADPENVSYHSDIESSGSTELPQAVSKNKDKVSFICTNVTQSKSTYYLFFLLKLRHLI